ncbi:MAG: hypothetical protein HPZ91_12780 [Lentisphaeria bacterium]|nr:hypothetical protein [Lentisphaeria bacterium]
MIDLLKASVYALVVYPAIACLVALVLTRACVSVLPRLGFVDMPDERRVHTTPTPRGGGVAIIAAFFLTAALYVVRHPDLHMGNFVGGFALPAAVILFGGLLDDRFSLGSRAKLLIQILAGILVWAVGARMKHVLGVELPDYLALPLTILWVVTIVNAFNLIDGMDGVAAGLGFLSAICLGLWGGLQNSSPGMVAVAFILAGSCAGFLRYNFSPASIFMGDTGSMFLGLFFAYAGLLSFGRSAALTSLLVPLLAIGVPLFDVTLAFWRRLVRRLLEPKKAKGIMTADLHHLHHRILKEVSSQRKAAIRIYLLGCLLAGLGFLTLLFERTLPALGYFVVLFLVLVVVRRVAGVELYDSARLLRNGLSRPRKLPVVLLSVPFADLAILLGANLLALELLELGYHEFWFGFICLAAPVPVLYLFSGNYRVLWLRTGYEELRLLIEVTLIGLIAGCSFFAVFCDRFNRELLPAFLVLYSLFAALGLGLVRIFLIYVGMRMMWHARQNRSLGLRKIRILIYGGGRNTALYLGHLYGSHSSEAATLVGIVDDDPAITGMKVFGLPVLGRGNDLESLADKYAVDKVVLTVRDMAPEREEKLLAFSARTGILLGRFYAEEIRIRPSPAGNPGNGDT